MIVFKFLELVYNIKLSSEHFFFFWGGGREMELIGSLCVGKFFLYFPILKEHHHNRGITVFRLRISSMA